MRLQNARSGLRILTLASALVLTAACSRPPADDGLPDVSYMCPMLKDAEVLTDRPGKCPKCGMELTPVRVVVAYSCLNNTAIMRETPGKCPTNGADMAPVTASMFWVCPAAPTKHELSPGACADGSARIKKLEPRLHGDHNPRHGGQLFMADDAWHHVEGAYPSAGVFHAFFYDDWTRPLAAQDFAARLTVKDAAGKELAAIRLEPGGVSNLKEARIPGAALPLAATLHVQFKAGDVEKFFDFSFKEYSRDSLEPAGVTAAPPPAAVEPAKPTPPDPAPVKATGPVPSPEPAPPALSPMDVIPTGAFQLEPIPASARDVLVELRARSQELSSKIEQRAPLGEYWVPALRSKDLALALVNDHLMEIPSRQRGAAENAAGRLLRAAYAIDNFGDLGDFGKILSAHEEFTTAVADLRTAYASIK